MKPFDLDPSEASPYTSFQLFPAIYSSHSFALCLPLPSFLYPEGSSPMCVFLLNFVVCVVYGQFSAMVFPVFVVQFIVHFYTESCLTELFTVVESVTDEAVPSPAGILPQDQRTNLPVVRKKERDYMGMFEYRKEDEHIIVKHLVHGMSFVCLLYGKISGRRSDTK